MEVRCTAVHATVSTGCVVQVKVSYSLLVGGEQLQTAGSPGVAHRDPVTVL